jgi:hypothetical protein
MPKWLFIDSRTRGSANFGWLTDSAKPKIWKVPADSPGLVSYISSRVSNSDLAEAKGICVVSGPGSFSSIRNGTLVANLLARIYGLPLVDVTAHEADDMSALVKSLSKRKPVEYVAPVYDQEPNITMPKKH